MSTSVINRKKAFRRSITFICVSVFCFVFSVIYESFSHDVYSAYMAWMFAIPLFLCAIPFSLLYLFKSLRYPSRFSENAYISGIVTLTVGSCLAGVIEIYGTDAPMLNAYAVVGIGFTAIGLLSYIFNIPKTKK